MDMALTMLALTADSEAIYIFAYECTFFWLVAVRLASGSSIADRGHLLPITIRLVFTSKS